MLPNETARAANLELVTRAQCFLDDETKTLYVGLVQKRTIEEEVEAIDRYLEMIGESDTNL